jgi:GNAT superfamily N-acetyltransferase
MQDFSQYVSRIRELNPDVIIREAIREDGRDFVSLFNRYYRRKTSLEYFQWQFFDSPFVSKLFLALEGEKLIGYYGIKKYPLSIGINTGFAVDLLVDDSFRKKGIVYLLENEVMRFCHESSISVLTALPNAHGKAALKSLGWNVIAKVDTLINTELDKKINISSTNEWEEATSLVEFLKGNEYREWRFCRNPLYQYETITLNDNIFAITKTFSDPVSAKRYGDIVDISWDGNLRSLQKLIFKIIADMKAKELSGITIWALSHTEQYNLFREVGFGILPQDRFFCVKLIESAPEELYDIKNWNLVQSDAEIF